MTTARERAMALATARVSALPNNPNLPGRRADTVGGPGHPDTASGGPEINIYELAVRSDSFGGTNIDRDLSITFIHESIHLDAGESAILTNWFERFFLRRTDDHGLEYYNDAAALYKW